MSSLAQWRTESFRREVDYSVAVAIGQWEVRQGAASSFSGTIVGAAPEIRRSNGS